MTNRSCGAKFYDSLPTGADTSIQEHNAILQACCADAINHQSDLHVMSFCQT